MNFDPECVTPSWISAAVNHSRSKIFSFTWRWKATQIWVQQKNHQLFSRRRLGWLNPAVPKIFVFLSLFWNILAEKRFNELGWFYDSCYLCAVSHVSGVQTTPERFWSQGSPSQSQSWTGFWVLKCVLVLFGCLKYKSKTGKETTLTFAIRQSSSSTLRTDMYDGPKLCCVSLWPSPTICLELTLGNLLLCVNSCYLELTQM